MAFVSIAEALNAALDPTRFSEFDEKVIIDDVTIELWSETIRLWGSRAALQETGLLPAGLRFPGDVPGKKGEWFRDSSGRVCRVGRGWCRGWGDFVLTIVRTKTEESSRRRLCEQQNSRATRIQELERLIKNQPTSVASAARSMQETVQFACLLIIEATLSDGAYGRLDDGSREKIKGGIASIVGTTRDAEVTLDDTRRAALVRERNALRVRAGDPGFQGFLGTVLVGKLSDDQHGRPA